jgi:hypothetical protein
LERDVLREKSVEINRKAGQNPLRFVAPLKEEEEGDDEGEKGVEGKN